MTESGSILVVVDKPKHAQVAFARARALAGASGARLRLVAFCWLAAAENRAALDAAERRALRRAVIRERKLWLRELVTRAGLAPAEVGQEVVWTDDIAGWVAEQASSRGARLVVKTVHQAQRLTHTPLDWQLLRTCPVPLYLANGEYETGSGNVLATVDLRHADRRHQLLNLRVLEAAGRIATLTRSRLHCVHVVEMPGGATGLEMLVPARLARDLKARAREFLDALLRPYAVPRARVHLPVGKLGVSIAEVAERVRADVVVVGSSARRGLGAVLLGNSVEKILTRIPCDVLAVHP